MNKSSPNAFIWLVISQVVILYCMRVSSTIGLGKHVAMLGLVLHLTACVSVLHNHHSLVTRLNNRGIVPLGQDNPYLAGNLLLNKEIERSPDLKGFIEHRGKPNALSVEHQLFGPLILKLFYTSSNQYYVLEELEETTWLIKGPFIPGKKEDESPAANIAPAPVTPKILGVQSDSRLDSIHTTAELISYFSQQNAAEAELSPKGDLVHYVTSSEETLATLSQWYTLDASNVERVRRINNFPSTQQLSVGDTVVIPSYLVKNKIRLTDKIRLKLVQIK